MPIRLAAFAAAVASMLCLATTPARADEATYYVAVGDSLSVGAQPGKGPTNEGYTDNLYAALKARHPGLRLVKLGCGGETTSTMMNGGICTYREGSQLKAAEAFLKQHQGRVRYVTLDIGANDTACFLDGDVACGLKGIGTIITNLPQITARLRLAGGNGPAGHRGRVGSADRHVQRLGADRLPGRRLQDRGR
jgi:lysophospholipase L1-like esterase